MDRIRAWFRTQEYEPIEERSGDDNERPIVLFAAPAFSWLEYSVFVLLGVSMLWAWNMFLAAGPYFEQRFRSNEWIAKNFQATELSVSTVGTLGMVFVLTQVQKGASYSARIFLALIINAVVFILLSISTKVFLSASASAFFGFLMALIFSSSVATGLFQNGIFAFVAGFGQPRYTQGIMVGQGIAGVLPCIAQIGLVLALSSDTASDVDTREEGIPGSVPSMEPPPVPSGAALAYFLTAVGISVATIITFSSLLKRRATQDLKASIHAGDDAGSRHETGPRKAVSNLVLFRKLRWMAMALFLVFSVTMFFPVFTQQIVSVTPIEQAPRILYPASFIPLAFLFWNSGDLIGRVLTAYPRLQLTNRPKVLFVLSIVRIVWIPLYHLCNINSRGAAINSDFFYLVVVQLGFGISAGYIGSCCMMGAADYVEPDEREAAGGFMGFCLVLGLAVGSLLSFLVSGG